MTDHTTPTLLTYQDVAKLLQVTDRTVWQLVKDGDLPALRFGGSVRIDPEDLRTFLKQAKQGCRSITPGEEGGP